MRSSEKDFLCRESEVRSRTINTLGASFVTSLLFAVAEPPPRGRHTPEPEKKGGLAGWGRLDPEEVLEDQTGAGKETSAAFMQPESEYLGT